MSAKSLGRVRYVMRNGEKVLQQLWEVRNTDGLDTDDLTKSGDRQSNAPTRIEWHDVPTAGE